MPDADGDIVVRDSADNPVKSFKKQYTDAMELKDMSEARQQEMYGTVSTDSIVNLGQYDLYTKGGAGEALELATTVFENGINYEMDYYLIEIICPDEIKFEDYAKETDLFYVIVKALQPRPEEIGD